MSPAGVLPWRWRRRAEPLVPRALVAWGGASRQLHARLAALAPERASRLSATASADLLVVSGDADALPWVDGGRYAAPCPEAAGLWLPTLWQPDVPCELLARALHRRHPRQPLLLWRDPEVIVPLDRLLPLSAEHLARIAAHWHDAPVPPAPGKAALPGRRPERPGQEAGP